MRIKLTAADALAIESAKSDAAMAQAQADAARDRLNRTIATCIERSSEKASTGIPLRLDVDGDDVYLVSENAAAPEMAVVAPGEDEVDKCPTSPPPEESQQTEESPG